MFYGDNNLNILLRIIIIDTAVYVVRELDHGQNEYIGVILCYYESMCVSYDCRVVVMVHND